MNKFLLAGFAIPALMVAYSGSSFSEKFEAMPPAVQATTTANMQNALPIAITTVKGEQGWEYQVSTRLNGGYHNFAIDEKGKLLAVQDETELAAIPASAKAAIESQAAAAKILKVEKVTEGGLVSYGAVMQDEAAGKYVRVRVAADGTLKSKKAQDTDR